MTADSRATCSCHPVGYWVRLKQAMRDDVAAVVLAWVAGALVGACVTWFALTVRVVRADPRVSAVVAPMSCVDYKP